ncbi:MAG: S-formylglutathione hydrolase [Pseudomonadota bacterium]
MSLKTISSWASFSGTLSVYDHASEVTGTVMRFAVFEPPQATFRPVPVVFYLSGLTCTWANVMEKSGLQRIAAELGIIVVAPDTSPRGDTVPDSSDYDLGQGAGFYLTATEDPWSEHFRMDKYVTEELPGLIRDNFTSDLSRLGIMGHSMGGHGAITLHLKHPELFKSCSAFAPITSPCQVPWGQKAFEAYLGPLSVAWEAYDATELVKEQPTKANILIDNGDTDDFLETQLRPNLFIDACKGAGQALTSRLQPGYDHSYYFVATFMEDHLRHHLAALNPD